MHRRVIAVILVLVVAGSVVPANAQRVGLFADAAATDLVITDAPGLVSIYVFQWATPGATAVQFSAPLPACVTGMTYLSDTAVFPVTIGTSQTGVAIGYGACLASPLHVLTINVFGQGLTTPESCCWYPVLPDPNVPSGEIEFVDCNSNLVFGTGSSGYVSSGGFGPPRISNPGPPDGATDQALDSPLSWQIETCSIGLGVVLSDVFFGTTMDPPLVEVNTQANTYDPGPLAPETTYYWKVHVIDTDAPASTTSPLWSFTTEPGVPTENSTWGQIKALYRD